MICTRAIRLVLVVALLTVLTGCQGSFNRKAGEESAVRAERIEDDPLGLAADFAVVPGHAKAATAADSATGKTTGAVDKVPAVGAAATTGRVESYRIQLFTSKTYQPAMTELNIAREVFDQKVWLDYEVPYYKIRVGDFADRESAEKYVPAAVEAGYSNAWVVKVNLDARRLEGVYDNAEIIPFTDSVDEDSDNSTEIINDTTQYPQNQLDNTGD